MEGDLGAPLEESELRDVEAAIDVVRPYLQQEAIEVLEKEGGYLLDPEGDFSTTTIDGKECAFAYYEEGVLKCSIEKAWQDGKTTFRKPISCHLYPIRVVKLHDHEAINYDRWKICSPACSHGESLGVPLYKFLKEPLVRKYGEEWYGASEVAIENGDA